MGEVLTEDRLEAKVAGDRRAGLSVAFANGCFDVLHVGHVRYLQSAAAEADRLIVAINDDRSVRGMKGANRPVLPAGDRAELVAALRGVDYVVIFPDGTVARLLERFKPDVHCKGTDYTVDTVPERETVRAYGGRIAIVGDPKNHSTSELLDRIASAERQIGQSAERDINQSAERDINQSAEREINQSAKSAKSITKSPNHPIKK